MKRLPIGISDFKKLIKGDYYYVDKTLLIKELLEQGAETVLLPRPRRFGKTLNLSMLYYFFSNTEKDSELFANTAISQHSDHMTEQGQYPVIFLTFKDIKEKTWNGAHKKIAEIIAQLFEKHKNILEKILTDRDLEEYNAILHQTSSSFDLKSSLKFLSDLLYRHYKKRIIFLLDEYDTPIQTAFINGYYQEMVNFIHILLNSILKDYNHLERGFLTGVLDLPKSDMLSGLLNNLRAESILDDGYSDTFGFTQSEVDSLLVEYKLENQSQSIKEWYNGYLFGETAIYNPWSLIHCIHNNGKLEPYWDNARDQAEKDFIKKVILHASTYTQELLEFFMHGEKINAEITLYFSLPDKATLNILFFMGYLASSKTELIMGRHMCDLIIPNKEVRIIYEQLLREFLSEPLSQKSLNRLEQALIEGDDIIFEKILCEYVMNSTSTFDLPANQSEKCYHLFILGLLVTLSHTYEVRSNRESGYGRYDIMLFPKDITKRGIIFEFKRTDKNEDLAEMAQDALDQINKKKYATELRSRGVQAITAFGIAFRGKEMVLKFISL